MSQADTDRKGRFLPKKKRRRTMGRIKILGLGFGLTLLVAAPANLWAHQNQPNAAPNETPVAATGPAPSAPPSVKTTHASTTGETESDLPRRNPRYRLQRDDVISVTFPLSPEFDQTSLTVQPDGYITPQEVGSIYVQDMTVPQVVEALKKAYSSILHDPIINVDLINFQRPYFTVSGQVGKPGQYDLRHDTTVAEAIATAGGLAPTAKTQVFVFHRVSQDWMQVKKLNLKDILNGKNVNEDAYLSPGDMIFVPEKFITKFRKYVPYGFGTSVGAGFY
jgi:protein involved in polysaccharide export with SLBB domain